MQLTERVTPPSAAIKIERSERDCDRIHEHNIHFK